MKCPVKDGPFLGDMLIFRGVPPKKITWQWNIHHFEDVFLLKMGIFQCHVNLQGSNGNELTTHRWKNLQSCRKKSPKEPPRHIGSLPMQQCTWRHKPQTYVFFLSWVKRLKPITWLNNHKDLIFKLVMVSVSTHLKKMHVRQIDQMKSQSSGFLNRNYFSCHFLVIRYTFSIKPNREQAPNPQKERINRLTKSH